MGNPCLPCVLPLAKNGGIFPMISIPKIWEIFTTKFSVFMQGVGTTVELALYTVVLGSILGLLVAIFRHTPILPIRWLMNA